MAIGNAKAKTNGVSSRNALPTIQNVAWPRTISGSNSCSELPTSSTKVNTNMVITNDASTCRNRYRCNVFKHYRFHPRGIGANRKQENKKPGLKNQSGCIGFLFVYGTVVL